MSSGRLRYISRWVIYLSGAALKTSWGLLSAHCWLKARGSSTLSPRTRGNEFYRLSFFHILRSLWLLDDWETTV